MVDGKKKNQFWRLNVVDLTRWMGKEREMGDRECLPSIKPALKCENGWNLCSQVMLQAALFPLVKKKKKNYSALVTYLTICVYTEGVYTHFYHSIGFFLLKFHLGFFPWEGWGREGSNFSNFHWQSMPAWDVLCVLCLSVCLLWGPNTITDVWWCPLSATQDTLSPCVQTPFKGKLE